MKEQEQAADGPDLFPEVRNLKIIFWGNEKLRQIWSGFCKILFGCHLRIGCYVTRVIVRKLPTHRTVVQILIEIQRNISRRLHVGRRNPAKSAGTLCFIQVTFKV